DCVRNHVRNLERAIVGQALRELQCDTQRDEAGHVGEAFTMPRVELREPEHQSAVRSEVTELVALLDRNLNRVRRKREPDHDHYQPNADRSPYAAQGYRSDGHESIGHGRRSVIPGERLARDPGSTGLRHTTLDSRFRGNDDYVNAPAAPRRPSTASVTHVVSRMTSHCREILLRTSSMA